MKPVVIIPALNEEATIADLIGRISTDIPGRDEVQIMAVNDGSSHGTARVAREAGAIVLSRRSNRGVRATFQTSIVAALNAGADIVVNMHADEQSNPADILARGARGDALSVPPSHYPNTEFKGTSP